MTGPGAKGCVVVTGAASGIGSAVVRLLAAREPDRPIVGIDLAWPRGSDVPCRQLVADVSDQAALAAAFDEADLRCVRGLVCAAGIQQRVPSLDVTPDRWRAVLATHVDGSFFASQLAARRMTDGGSIVLFSSVAEFFAWPERTAYAVAKAGISAMARSLAVEWSERGIRVNAIAPGYVDTPLIARARARGELAVEPADLHALGRLADPQEIAAPVSFLLSPDASFITGETLVADGGYRVLKSR